MIKSKPVILVVDDEPEIISLMDFILKKEGCEVVSATNGEEALLKMRDRAFSAVVCDYRMPLMSGIQLLERVREALDLTPFIFVSGNAGDQEQLKMASLGACEMLDKTDILKVGEFVRKHLGEREEMDRLAREGSEDTREFISLLHSTKS